MAVFYDSDRSIENIGVLTVFELLETEVPMDFLGTEGLILFFLAQTPLNLNA